MARNHVADLVEAVARVVQLLALALWERPPNDENLQNRERECVCERERVSVCARESGCVSERKSACVCEREGVCLHHHPSSEMSVSGTAASSVPGMVTLPPDIRRRCVL